jgi:sulfate adenylyltransferase subunit 1
MGRVESGSIKVGDKVTVLPNGLESTVKAVQLGGVDIGEAFTEQSVTILLADEIDTSRGDMIVKTAEAPAAVKEIAPPSAGWPKPRSTAPAPT